MRILKGGTDVRRHDSGRDQPWRRDGTDGDRERRYSDRHNQGTAMRSSGDASHHDRDRRNRSTTPSHRSGHADRRQDRSRSRRNSRLGRAPEAASTKSPPRCQNALRQHVGFAYGEGRQDNDSQRSGRVEPKTIGYAYGEGKRATKMDQNGAHRHGKQPRNALLPPGRCPDVGTSHRSGHGKQQRSRSDYSHMTPISEYSSGSAGSGASPSSISSESDDEEEEEEKAKPPPPKLDSRRDEIIHFDWKPGMVLNMKYELIKALGDGTFGRVVLAHDRRDDRHVAIKIIRDVKRYMENAKIEANILKDVAKADPKGMSRCAMMYETFTHERKYYCLVFEPLGVSLYDFMKKNTFRGFWMSDIQSFAKQCIQAMRFLHKELRLAHTDLKPENILLECTEPPRPDSFFRESDWKARGRRVKDPPPYVRPASTSIKIIDFGNATYESEHHSSIINTRQYRGPEVVLEMTWNESSDIWSLGCIFMELYTGELLFSTHDNFEHLALMEEILSPLPSRMLDNTLSTVKQKYLRQDSRSGSWVLDWPARASSEQSQKHVSAARTLKEIVREPSHKSFLLLAYSMLTADPSRRPAASQVLHEPFFDAEFDD